MSTTRNVDAGRGTLQAPRYYDGAQSSDGDVHLRGRVFTYETDDGLVGGYEIGVMFTIDRPAATVWPHFKDWEPWQREHGYFYSSAPGGLYSSEQLDLGTETFRITVRNPDMMEQLGLPRDHEYQSDDYVVLRVIPEHLIVIFQPVPQGKGAVSPGFHAFLLNEHDGRTTITGNMEHAGLADKGEEETLAYWQEGAAEVVRFWGEIFVPQLKKLVYES
jgi:hypothetical protein